MAATPRAVIFDFGGVIWDMRWDVCAALETAHGLARGAVFRTLYRCEAWSEVERGRGAVDAWLAGAHRALEESVGRPLPPLHEQWRGEQAPIADNVAFIRTLRPRYRLAILSNADRTLRPRLENGLGIHDLFEDIVCSAEVGLAKPEPEIFALACARLELAPGACAFVDDYDVNVHAAAAAGLRAVLYRRDRGDDLRARLAEVGVA